MDKLEKVIKGLECCLKDDCDNCPYYDPEVDHDCDYFGKCLRGNMYHDALALLKVQEPVEPKKNDMELAGLRTWDWACPECNCILLYRANYCSCCGRAVKWE